jgi:hypothetical protein
MAGAALGAGAARGFNCPSCGAGVALRGLAWTQTVACESCGAVVDARDPNLRILQEAQARMTVRPLIPLGSRGEWRGAPYEVIGFQQRTITADGVAYSWREYLLFNPYRGFRYLTEYDGHWNDVVPLAALPETGRGRGGRMARHDGVAYRHFQTASAHTTFVLGEFPWEVRVGDVARVQDYVAPPRLLSAESTDDETTWSLGTYADGQAIWRAFGLPGAPPAPRGIYANQPSPHAGAGAWWRTFGVLAAALLLAFFFRLATARNERAFEGRFAFGQPRVQPRGAARPPTRGAAGETPFGAATAARGGTARGDTAAQGFVTAPFELRGNTSNVVVETEADVDGEWLFLDYALVNEATGEARRFAREVSYYSGVDGGERWSEGSRRDHTTLGRVPPGRYVLRVEPAGEPRAGRAIAYTVRVRRDVPSLAYYLAALVLLAAPPVFGSLQAASFETRRWAESDQSSGSDDE